MVIGLSHEISQLRSRSHCWLAKSGLIVPFWCGSLFLTPDTESNDSERSVNLGKERTSRELKTQAKLLQRAKAKADEEEDVVDTLCRNILVPLHFQKCHFFVLTVKFLFLCVMLRITTLNVNGLRKNEKREILFNHLKREKHDIICLQETHSIQGDENFWRQQWGGDIFFSHGESSSRGVAILASNKSGIKLNNMDKDKEGRIVKADFMWEGINIGVVSVYAPNLMYDRKQFFRDLDTFLYEGHNWIVNGDFNCQLDIDHSDKSISELNNLLLEKDMYDIWRTCYPDEPGYTFYHKVLKRSSRIDYSFITSNLLFSISEANVSSVGLSDHCALSFRLQKQEVAKGPGRWFCNNNILKEEQCKDRITFFWDYWKTQKNTFESVLNWWDFGKMKLKEIIKDYDSEIYYKEKKDKIHLQKTLSNLMNEPSSDPNAILEVENEIKNYEMKDLEKSRMKMHITKLADEKPSKLFFGMEKQRTSNNIINNLKDDDSNYYSDSISMCNYVNSFYQNLYSAENVDSATTKEILKTVKTYSFPDDVVDNLEVSIQGIEVCQAINQMKTCKSPGIDGLTTEFYQLYWQVIKDDFIEVINECYQKGALPPTMNSALIRLIYKNKGERSNLKNWRPISLLNVDYKIISKVITNRLKRIMPFIIGTDQSCGVQDRNISDNLTVLRDIIFFINNENEQAAILSIDQEKAFDRIEWNYMFNMMETMGIPTGLINWVNILYSNPTSSVIVNNFIT